jgi:hypothetical protein
MTDGPTLQVWQVRCLRELTAIGVEIVVEIRHVGPQRRRAIGAFGLFRRVFGRSRSTRRTPSAEIFSRAELISCATIPAPPFGEALSAADTSAIRARKLDAILRFGFGVLRGDVLNAARLGVWSFHHGDDDGYRGSPAGFWELVDGVPLTAVILQRLTDRLDAGVVLEKGYFNTIQHSYGRNLDQVLMAGTDWPAKLVSLELHGIDLTQGRHASTSSTPIRRAPGVAVCVAMACRLSVRRLRWSAARVMLHDDWNIGVVDARVEDIAGGGDLGAVRWFPKPPRGTFLADPFVVHERLILAEWYDYRTGMGRIAALKRPEGANQWGRPTSSGIDVPVHASYPSVVHADGAVWCTPETFGAREVAAWQSSSLGERWERVATLIPDVAVVDPTVVEYDGLWWLFGTVADDAPQAKLRVWWAPAITGPWSPHAGNPVKSDVRSARPAGPLFVHDGALHRPAQDSSRTYGGGIAINRIDVLTPVLFAETTVASVPPGADGTYRGGIHTISSAAGLTVIDGKRRQFVPSATVTELLRVAPPAIRRRAAGRGQI